MSQGYNPQAMQQIRKLEQAIARHADRIEELDKAERTLRLDLREQQTRLSTRVESVREHAQS